MLSRRRFVTGLAAAALAAAARFTPVGALQLAAAEDKKAAARAWYDQVVERLRPVMAKLHRDLMVHGWCGYEVTSEGIKYVSPLTTGRTGQVVHTLRWHNPNAGETYGKSVGEFMRELGLPADDQAADVVDDA